MNKKKFNENSKILSIRVPASHFNYIKYIIDRYITKYSKSKNNQVIPIIEGFRRFSYLIRMIQEKPLIKDNLTFQDFKEFANKRNIKLFE